jgi:thioredoxin domain-containing protein 5
MQMFPLSYFHVAPWCGHCKKLVPIYDELANELKGEVSVAKVDVTQNKDLGTRFEIKGFPTIKLISKGKTYTYKGKRTVEDMAEFARGGYQMHAAQEVAPPVGFFGEIGHIYTHAYKQATKDLKKGRFFTVDVFLTFLPVIFCLLIALLVCVPSPAPRPRKPKQSQAQPQEGSEHKDAAPSEEEEEEEESEEEKKEEKSGGNRKKNE